MMIFIGTRNFSLGYTRNASIRKQKAHTASSYQKQAQEESIKIILSYVKIFHDSYPLNLAWTFSFESCFRPPFKIPPSPLLNRLSARLYLSTETFFSLITIIIDDVIITLIAQPFRSLFSKKKVPRGGLRRNFIVCFDNASCYVFKCTARHCVCSWVQLKKLFIQMQLCMCVREWEWS